MEELARFHTARNHFRNYLKARRELDSRLLRLKLSHKARKAFERLAGVGKFQCRADDCACNFAAAHGGFPDFETPIDVFYGKSQLIERREWRNPILSTLDLELLQELGNYAEAFMQSTRALPCFERSWNTRTETKWIFKSSPLNLAERTFRKAHAACVTIFYAFPLAPEDTKGVLLCLKRKLPPGLVEAVLRFLCATLVQL